MLCRLPHAHADTSPLVLKVARLNVSGVPAERVAVDLPHDGVRGSPEEDEPIGAAGCEGGVRPLLRAHAHGGERRCVRAEAPPQGCAL
eukprot:6192237-Pleurochrysis_carterae.AAC.1